MAEGAWAARLTSLEHDLPTVHGVLFGIIKYLATHTGKAYRNKHIREHLSGVHTGKPIYS